MFFLLECATLDSVTQFALGAAIGEASLGRKLGRPALLWGALCGTLPDLDVFVPLGDPVADFTYHRSVSHSFFVLALITPLIIWLMRRVHKSLRDERATMACVALVYGAFATHILLDSFTVYGTQIFWPFDTTPASWSSLFIIDPLYTLPLLVGIVLAFIFPKSRHASRWNWLGLGLSSLYIFWSYSAKLFVEQRVEKALTSQNITYDRLLSTPAPLNTFLWRLVARSDGGYYEIFYSIFAKESEPLDAKFFSSADELIPLLQDNKAAQRLIWFTHGFFKIYQRGQDIVISDIRMGIEPDYVFQFAVASVPNQEPPLFQGESNPSQQRTLVTRHPARIDSPPNVDRLKELFKRI